MARRRVKRRTHAGAKTGAANGGTDAGSNTPKSMVLRIGAGEVGSSVSQLVKDVRQVMEPNTASRLKERKSNKLRDYTTMTGPLGVTHLLLFSKSPSGNTNMRLVVTPRGPTLHFRVERYSLCKDIMRAQKHPKSGIQNEFLTAPLLVMNNFQSPESSPSSNVPAHLEKLVTNVFQYLFPAISPQATPLSTIKRVLLMNRELPTPGTGTSSSPYILNFRHYAITTKRTGLSKSIRRLNAAEKMVAGKAQDKKRGKGLPNLGKLEDVADYLLDPSAAGYTSASESEVETDAEVEVLAPSARKVLGKREKQRADAAREAGEARRGGGGGGRGGVERRAVKLVELGPRMRLRLVKVEEGVCAGKVMWHEFVHKSKQEEQDMDRLWEGRRKEKEERRRVQRENVEWKRKERGEGAAEDEEDEDDEFLSDEYEDVGEEDDDSVNAEKDDQEIEDDEG